MTLNTIIAAEVEAKKFLEKVKIVRQRAKDDKYLFIVGCKESADMRRKSMDLTRALANMRKPGRIEI